MALLAGALVLPIPGAVARADTLEGALALAYQNNPSLNAQRAGIRATDENVPQALAGYRPKGQHHRDRRRAVAVDDYQDGGSGAAAPSISTASGYNSPFSVGLTMTQTLFNGFQTANRTRQAEAQVLSARATLPTPCRPCCSTPSPPT